MPFFYLALQMGILDPAALDHLEAPLREALAIEERQSGRGSAAYAGSAAQFARFLARLNRRDEALGWYRIALAIREAPEDLDAAAGLDPANAATMLARAAQLWTVPGPKSRSLRRLAALLEARGDSEGAGSAYRQALDAARRASPAEAGVAANDLGLFVENQGEMREAEGLYRQALAFLEKAHGPRHPEAGTTLNNLAGAVGAQGRLAEAELLLRRAVAMLESTAGSRHRRTAAARENLGELLAATGRAEEARRMLAAAAAAYRASGDPAAAEQAERRAASLH